LKKNLCIGDFDTAKLLTEHEQAKTVVGTAGYISPEILRSNRISYSFPADIWSFGMIIYEMMTLKRPYEDIRVNQISDLVEKGKLPYFPEELDEKYSPLLTFCKKCLSLNPNDRPSVKRCKEILATLL